MSALEEYEWSASATLTSGKPEFRIGYEASWVLEAVWTA
jgi:hypothetical protein